MTDTTVGNLTVRVGVDPDPLDPRAEYDNFGTMVCFHNKYNLGDKHDYKIGDFSNWEELETQILKDNPGAIVLPLFLFDHSGLSISTGSAWFRACDSMAWDWGQVGFIFASADTIRSEYSVKRISKQLRQRVTDLLESEVEAYNRYFHGEAYFYQVSNAEGEVLDSCFGFDDEAYALSEGQSIAEWIINRKEEAA